MKLFKGKSGQWGSTYHNERHYVARMRKLFNPRLKRLHKKNAL